MRRALDARPPFRHDRRVSATDAVRAYRDALDPTRQALFDRLEACVLAAAPDAAAAIGYGIPLYRLGKRHVGLSARKDGVSLTTTSPDHIAAFHARYPRIRVNTASVAFRLADAFADEDVRAVVRRALELEAQPGSPSQ